MRRASEQIILALDKLLVENSNIRDLLDIKIIAPKNLDITLELKNIDIIYGGVLSGFLKNIPWEQLNLPLLTRNGTLLSLANLSSIFKINSIVMIHDAYVWTSPQTFSYFFRVWYKLLLPILGKFSSRRIITISEYSKFELVQHGITRSDKVTVIPNGCDHFEKIICNNNILQRHDLQLKKYFVAQANIQYHKNIKTLIEAFKSDLLSDSILVLYGNKNRKDFENLGLKVPNNIIFTGRVSDAELKSLLRDATATLTPSFFEGFGLQPLEGMNEGTPAIASTGGALPEVCGSVSYFAEPDNVDQWIKTINQLAVSPPTNSVEKIKSQAKKYTWEKTALKLCECILRN